MLLSRLLSLPHDVVRRARSGPMEQMPVKIYKASQRAFEVEFEKEYLARMSSWTGLMAWRK
jgi:hypothetical protein